MTLVSLVCVVGLGKMGLPLAAFFASRNLEVVGCDVNLSIVAAVNQGVCPIPNEPEVPEMMVEAVAAGRLRATTDTPAAVSDSDVIVIIVPLMIDALGEPDYRALDAAIEAVGRGLRPGALVVLETTLPVGDTRRRFGAHLEKTSGLRMGSDFHLAFSPERVQSNRVIKDLVQYPKVVGGIDAPSTSRAAAFYGEVLGLPVLEVSSSEAAEFTKLAECVYRDVNIALVNQLAQYAEQSGLDMAEVIPAANSEPLSHLHRPGLGVGGHCIPVYPHFLLRQSSALEMVALARSVNDAMPGIAADAVLSQLGGAAGMTILILGIAYRPNVKEAHYSPAVRMARYLEEQGARALVNDPLFDADELNELGLEAVDLDSLPAVDAVVLHTNHAEYRELKFGDLVNCRVVLDGAGVLDRVAIEAAGMRYMRVGRAPATEPLVLASA